MIGFSSVVKNVRGKECDKETGIKNLLRGKGKGKRLLRGKERGKEVTPWKLFAPWKRG